MFCTLVVHFFMFIIAVFTQFIHIQAMLFAYIELYSGFYVSSHVLFMYVLVFDMYTVEPLTNDHPHQRPSLSYDHISCDGLCILFVYESLTSDHPSYTTTPM